MGYMEHLRTIGFAGVEQPMSGKVAEWWTWYTATHAWYSSTETSAADRRTYKVERISVKPARMVCQEWASLIMNERTQIVAEDATVNAWLDESDEVKRLMGAGQQLVERAFALGTAAWALRVEGMVEGQLTSPGARFVAQRFDARSIIPLSYDEDSCTECAFVSEVVVHGARYTQLQVHRLNDDSTYRVETYLFDKEGKLVSVPGILPALDTKGKAPLFALVKPGLENAYADYCPFGVSIFDDAIGAVQLVDEAVDNMHRDIWLGQKMVFLDERMLEKDAAGNITVPRSKDQQLFRKTETDSGNQLIEEYNPDLRVTDNRLALKTGLELLGARCGLGSDYFSIDGDTSGVKTATEVMAEDSDLFRNVRKHENAIAPAVKTIVVGILSLARTIRGDSLPEDIGEIRVDFDDSILEDTNAQRERDRKDVAAQLMSVVEYRQQWYAEDKDAAKKSAAALAGEELSPEE